jgi:WD40 repeat protein
LLFVIFGGLLVSAYLSRWLTRDGRPTALQAAAPQGPTDVATPSSVASTPKSVTDPPARVPQGVAKEGFFRTVAWSPKAPWLAGALGVGLQSSVYIFDTRTWACTQQIPVVSVVAASWGPDGDRLAVAGANGTVQIWGVDGALITSFKQTPRSIQAMDWSPDGKALAKSEVDGTVRLWSPDGTPGPVLSAHKGPVRMLAWSPDSKYLATAGQDQAVRIWAADGTQRRAFQLEYSISATAWDRTATQLALSLGTCSIQILGVDGKEGQPIDNGRHLGLALAWEPNDKFLAVGDNGGKVKLFTPEGVAGPTLDGDVSILSTPWSRDGKLLAAGTGTAKVYLWSADGTPVKVLQPPVTVPAAQRGKA